MRARSGHGRRLNFAAQKEGRGQDLTRAAVKLFGSWDRALAASGFRPDRVRLKRRWTREKVVAAIRELGRFVGSHIMSHRDGGLVQAALAIFGGWRQAYEAAGIPYTPSFSSRRKWTRELALATLRKRARLGQSLSSRVVGNEISALYLACLREFGGWRPAVLAAGCGDRLPDQARLWSREEIVKELRRLRAQGKPVGKRFLKRHRPPGRVSLLTAIGKTFGTLSRAKEAAGYPDWARKSPGRWTRETILEAVRERARKGASLRPKHVAREIAGLYGAAYREFGTWNAAREAAGVPPEQHRWPCTWTREKITDAVRSLEAQGYFRTHGHGLWRRKDLLTAIQRHFKEAPSVVVRRILGVKLAAP